MNESFVQQFPTAPDGKSRWTGMFVIALSYPPGAYQYTSEIFLCACYGEQHCLAHAYGHRKSRNRHQGYRFVYRKMGKSSMLCAVAHGVELESSMHAFSVEARGTSLETPPAPHVPVCDGS